MIINDWGKGSYNVNHGYNIDINHIPNDHQNHYIDNMANTGNIIDGNDSDVNDDRHVEYRYNNDARRDENANHNYSTYKDEKTSMKTTTTSTQTKQMTISNYNNEYLLQQRH